jgi:hypothetical protein
MAVGIVDALEAVEVDEEQRQAAAVRLGPTDRIQHHLLEGGTVGQRRQHVMARQVLEPPFVVAEGRVVAEDADIVGDPPVGFRDGREAQSDRVGLAVLALVLQFALPATVASQCLGDLAQLAAVGAAHPWIARRVPDRLRLAEAGDGGECGIDRHDPEAPIGDHHGFAGVGHGVGRDPQHPLGAQAAPDVAHDRKLSRAMVPPGRAELDLDLQDTAIGLLQRGQVRAAMVGVRGKPCFALAEQAGVRQADDFSGRPADHPLGAFIDLEHPAGGAVDDHQSVARAVHQRPILLFRSTDAADDAQGQVGAERHQQQDDGRCRKLEAGRYASGRGAEFLGESLFERAQCVMHLLDPVEQVVDDDVRRPACVHLRLQIHTQLLQLPDVGITLFPEIDRPLHRRQAAAAAKEKDQRRQVLGMMTGGEQVLLHQRLVDGLLLQLDAGRAVAQRHAQRLFETMKVGRVAGLAVAVQQEGGIMLRLRPLAFTGDIAAHGGLHRDRRERDGNRNGGDANEDEGDGEQPPGPRRALCRIERHREGQAPGGYGWRIRLSRVACRTRPPGMRMDDGRSRRVDGRARP